MTQPLIDSHIHFACAERLGELIEYRNELSLERMGIVSLPDPERVSFNPEVLYAKLMLPDLCYGFASFDYSLLMTGRGKELDLAAQVGAAVAAGFDGIKMWEGKPAFQRLIGKPLDDPLFAPAYAAAARLRMPIVLHVADPPLFWSAARAPGQESSGAPYGAPAAPSFEELQEQAERILRANRGCSFIFPHLLFRTGDLVAFTRFMEEHPNAWLDLSPGRYFYGDLHAQRAAAKEFLARFSSRILFGSDAMWFCPSMRSFPPADLSENLERARRLEAFLSSDSLIENPFEPTRAAIPAVRGLALSPEILRSLYRDSFRGLFGERPRRVSRGDARELLAAFRRSLELVHGGVARRRTTDAGEARPIRDSVLAEIRVIEEEVMR